MKRFTNRLMVLFFTSMLFGVNGFAYNSDVFVITVDSTNPGTSVDTAFTIPTHPDYAYAYEVDCDNDGTFEYPGKTGDFTCGFSGNTPPPQTIAIKGTFPAIYFNNEGDKDKILSVEKWGSNQWQTMNKAFAGTSNLTIDASDTPNLLSVTDMTGMFWNAISFNQYIGDWDVSNITSMAALFRNATAFNQDLNNWNVSKVTDMQSMFYDATAFNQDIGRWNVSEVTLMTQIFYGATAFNQNISNWNTSKVKKFSSMFWNATSFDQPIGSWNTIEGTEMRSMFSGAISFNQPIGNWNISRVTDLSFAFSDATVFNQDISNWDVSKVTNMNSLFSGTEAFNQDISDWNTSKVTQMINMFSGATAFNQDISALNVSSVSNMQGMFQDTTLFNQDLSKWDISNIFSMAYMFKGAKAFNQDLSWDVSSVTHMQGMFDGATAFNQDISRWDISNVIYMESIFNAAHLSISNYDHLLNTWYKLPPENDVLFDAGNSWMCEGGTGEFELRYTFGWTGNFGDVNGDCDFFITSRYHISVENKEQFVGYMTTTLDTGEQEDDFNYRIIQNVADGDKFEINGRGRLSFINPPDAKNPTDLDGDNMYRVQIYANDGDDMFPIDDRRTINVTVLPDENEVTLVPVISYLLF